MQRRAIYIIYWYGINKNINDVELTNMMQQLESAIRVFADSQWRSQFEHDHGRRASRLVERTLTDVRVLSEYQTAGKYYTSPILSANMTYMYIYTYLFCLNTATAGTPRHVCKTFHANIRRSDLPLLNIKWNMAQKLDPTLKPSNYKQLRKIHMISAQKPNVHAVFKR